LLNGLNILVNTFLFGFVSPKLVPAENWKGVASKIAVFGDVEVPLGPLTRQAFDPDGNSREGFKRNYENSLLRTLVREAHEMILLYCEQSQQFSKYKAEPWFQFARVLRNVISHKESGTLRGWPSDLLKSGITSVSWRGKHSTRRCSVIM
jgi:hypothetical protein